VITIDFETHYAKDFSLSKITVEEYLRDPRFQTIGVSVKVDGDPGVWYPRPQVKDALHSYNLHEHEVLAHNSMFDGAILNWKYGIKPGFWLDTLSMAKPFHQMTVGGSLAKLAKHYDLPDKGDEVVQVIGMRYEDFDEEGLARYGRYCCHDGDLAYQIYHKLLDAGFPRKELVSIDQTIRMFTEPCIELDLPVLTEHLLSERARKEHLLHTVLGGAPTPEKLTGLRSNPQFAQMLTDLGVVPPTKISKLTDKVTYAFAKTDAGMMELADHPNEAVSLLTRARLGVKSSIEETRAERFIGVAERGLLPVDLNYYGAHTGRYSGGSKLNLQNLPSRGDSNALRRSLLAPEDCVFISADSSQIEARILAWLAEEDDLVQAFREGRDVYCEFGLDIFGRKITKEDKDERFVGKTGILSLGYGAGGPRFRDMLRTQGGVMISVDEAYRIVDMYRERYPNIPRLWRRANTMLSNIAEGYEGRFCDLFDYGPNGIELPSGFRIQYPGLYQHEDGTSREMRYLNDPRAMAVAAKARFTGKQDDIDAVKWTKIYGGKCIENLTQALASCVIRRQARTMRRKGYHMALQVHDDLLFAPRVEDAVDCAATLKQVMSRSPAWAPDLPLACEVKVGTNYGEMRVVG
jgi:DNA polymerase